MTRVVTRWEGQGLVRRERLLDRRPELGGRARRCPPAATPAGLADSPRQRAPARDGPPGRGRPARIQGASASRHRSRDWRRAGSAWLNLRGPWDHVPRVAAASSCPAPTVGVTGTAPYPLRPRDLLEILSASGAHPERIWSASGAHPARMRTARIRTARIRSASGKRERARFRFRSRPQSRPLYDHKTTENDQRRPTPCNAVSLVA